MQKIDHERERKKEKYRKQTVRQRLPRVDACPEVKPPSPLFLRVPNGLIVAIRFMAGHHLTYDDQGLRSRERGVYRKPNGKKEEGKRLEISMNENGIGQNGEFMWSPIGKSCIYAFRLRWCIF